MGIVLDCWFVYASLPRNYGSFREVVLNLTTDRSWSSVTGFPESYLSMAEVDDTLVSLVVHRIDSVRKLLKVIL
jgi:hypothetical protein